jgi:hypothetical protein
MAVEALVYRAIKLGFLRVKSRTRCGITLALGTDPRKPIAEGRPSIHQL